MLRKVKLTKHIKTVTILASFLLLFTGMAKAYDISAANVRLTDNNNSYDVKTNASTVEELLRDEEVVLDELDEINVSALDTVSDNMEIVIKRAFFVNVSIDGKEPVKIKTNENTVGKVVNNLEKENGTKYIIGDGISYSKAEPNMDININSVKEVVETRKDSIPFETVINETDKLEKGKERVIVQGVDGEKETEVKTVYVGGKVASIADGDSVVIKAPVNKVIERGTKVPEPPKPVEQPKAKTTSVKASATKTNASSVPTIKTNKGSFQVVKQYSMKATAYTDTGYNTASGMKAAVGVVAVDPKVIPLGTKLYVEGYGYAIAGDTGGAIKNNRIDLFFNTERECVRYGVKNNIKVYVLGKQV